MSDTELRIFDALAASYDVATPVLFEDNRGPNHYITAPIVASALGMLWWIAYPNLAPDSSDL
jgi:hypothetical protein